MFLEAVTWAEAEKALSADAVVVLPLGAGAKEHGHHLLLSNDRILAERLAARVELRTPVVVAPTISFHYYPAFVEYPGSISLRLETAHNLVVDVCRSLARFGPRRFYALNTGVSTLRALAPAADELDRDGIVLAYTDLLVALDPAARELSEQQGGTHADEIETSMMLHLEPAAVDMTRAAPDYHPGQGPLTRDPANSRGTYSPTGVRGDPTLATEDKGRRLVAALVDAIVADIERLRARAVGPR